MGAAKPTITQRRRQAVASAAALVLIGVVFVVVRLINHSHDASASTHHWGATPHSVTATHSGSPHSVRTPARTSTRRAAASTTGESADVGPRVTRTLALIDAGQWPPADSPGTHGGTYFGNNEGHLPSKTSSGKRISYKEWDVNRKKSGQGRDAERIVTGSDGSAWYTADHYRTFVKIRGPNR
ncbi:MAG: ribonuclease domain-containing protein [Gordonia sp. (in: high G+C Gram-positive bacteria)]